MVEQQTNPPKPSLGRLLAKVSRLVGGRMRTKLEGIGLHHAQGMILSHLWRQDGLAQNALAQALHITPPTATSTLQRMERDGWVERRRDAADQRVVRVFLTPKADALRAEALATFRELDRELAAVLTDEERSALLASLLKVHHHLTRSVEGSEPSGPGQGDPADQEDGPKEER